MGRRRISRMIGMAEELHLAGRVDAAAQAFEMTLELCRGADPRSHLTARCLNGLSRVRRDQGDFDAAEESAREALEIELAGDGGVARSELAADAMNNLGSIEFRRSRLDSAAEWYQRAFDIFEVRGKHGEAAVVLGNLGSVEQERNGPEAALPYYQRALERARSGPAGFVGTCLNNIGSVHHVMGDLDAALDAYSQALEWLHKAGRPAAGALALGNVGHVHLDRGAFAEAEECYQGALAIARAISDDSPEVADQLANLARVTVATGELDRALEYGNQALAIDAKAAPGGGAHVRDLGEIASVLLARGELAQALRLVREALRLTEAISGRSMRTAAALNNVGGVYQDIGDLPKALDYFQRGLAMQLAIAPMSMNAASMHNNVGTVLRALGRVAEAREHYEAALAIDRATAPRSAKTAVDLANLGVLLCRHGDVESGLSHLLEALAIDRECAPGSVAVAGGLAAVARVRLQKGNPDGAEELITEALRIDRELVPDSDRTANDLVLLAEIHAARGAWEPALAELRRAAEIAESLRARTGHTPRARELALAERHAVHHAIVAVQYRVGGADAAEAAFVQAEKARARVLGDLLAERGLPLTPSNAEQQELIDAERRLRWRLTALREAAQRGTAGREALDPEVRSDRLRIEEDWEDVTDRLRLAFPVYQELKAPVAASLQDVAAVLADDEQLVSYCFAGDEVFVWTVTRRRQRMLRLEVHADEVTELVEAALGAYRRMERGGEAELAAQRELAEVLLAPVGLADDRMVRRLVIVPDAALTMLPFELLGLPDADGTLLADRFTVSYAPSASVLVHLRKRGGSGSSWARSFVGFGDPALSGHDDLVGALAPLPGTRKELHDIAELFEGEASVHVGADATEKNVRRDAPGSRYLHFATHGILDSADPLFCGLVLSPPAEGGPDAVGEQEHEQADEHEHEHEHEHDNILHTHEIFGLPLTAEVVVCSACDTGRGAFRGGEGLMGLSRAFLAAGAQCVVVALWPVRDIPARRLMVRFYQHLVRGVSPAEALRMAKSDVRARNPRVRDDPASWAAFVVIGDAQIPATPLSL